MISVEQYWYTNPLKSCIEQDWQNKVQHDQLSPIHVTVHIVFIGGQKVRKGHFWGNQRIQNQVCVLRDLHQAE